MKKSLLLLASLSINIYCSEDSPENQPGGARGMRPSENLKELSNNLKTTGIKEVIEFCNKLLQENTFIKCLLSKQEATQKTRDDAWGKQFESSTAEIKTIGQKAVDNAFSAKTDELKALNDAIAGAKIEINALQNLKTTIETFNTNISNVTQNIDQIKTNNKDETEKVFKRIVALENQLKNEKFFGVQLIQNVKITAGIAAVLLAFAGGYICNRYFCNNNATDNEDND